MPLTRRAALALAVALAGAACQQASPPVVQQQTHSAAAGSIDVVAVIPFYPRPELQRYTVDGEQDPEEIAALVATYFTEALAGQDVRVVPPSDVRLAFETLGSATPRRDPLAAAQVMADKFGATSVVLGEVYRWRERRGQNYGAESPASVGYELRLHDATSGRRLWSSRFDHTQRTLTADPLTARKYPGGGTRFLTAAELARWGASAAAVSLVQGQWRSSK